MLAVVTSVPVSAQYAAHSVLSNGDWWKIEIADAGIYRLTTNDISALSSCSIDQIALFGHSGG